MVWISAPWALAAAPGDSAETPTLDAATAEEVQALGEAIRALLEGLPPDQRDAVRRQLGAALQTPEMPTEAPAQAEGKVTAEPAPIDTAVTEKATAEPVVTEPAVTETVVAETAAAETTVTEVAPQAVPPVAAPPARPTRVRKPRCNTLLPFDENADGKITSLDRHWRHLYLWTDRNRDGAIQDKEIESAYERGVREIAADLDSFYRKQGSLGEIRWRERILFDIGGDGFGESRRVDDGALAFDADALRRGDGPDLLDAAGQPVTGTKPLASGWSLRWDGETTSFDCPH